VRILESRRGSGVRERVEEVTGRTAWIEGAEPREILRWAAGEYGERLALSLSFGNPEGMVLLDMITRIPEARDTVIFTLDTGFLFEETVRFREEVVDRYGIDLKVVRPALSVEEQVERYGEALRSCKPDMCCQIRKVEPQKRFLADYDAWITGIRRDQTSLRADTPVLGWEERFGVAKVSPLAAWGSDLVEEYVREHDVPLNPLLDMGYRSIGCEPQTRPVAPDEDARAGRWAGLDKTECGLHFAGGEVKRAQS
jgi:phosphoadenosine phosphosulfate reductase